MSGEILVSDPWSGAMLVVPAPRPEPDLGRGWCSTCRRMKSVTDRFTESVMDRSGEIEFRVEVLDCDHSNQSGGRVVAPAPGAPYVGIKGVRRPRDLGRFDRQVDL